MSEESTSKTSSRIKIYLSHPWYLIKTGYLLLTWIMMGFHLELIGPTMSIVASNINVTYSGMGSVLASRSAGYLIANFLGAILQNLVKDHSEGLLFCAFILPAIVVFATPFVTSLILMCVISFIQRVCKGLTDLGGNNLVLTMWTVNAAAPLNSVHLGYGLGAVFANLLVRPFITQKMNPNIVIPYSITAILCFLIAVGHIFFYISALRSRKENLQAQEVIINDVNTNLDNVNHSVNKKKSSRYSPRICGRGFFQYGLISSIIFIMYAFCLGGSSQTFSKFFFSFLKFDKFHLSTKAASWGMIVFWLSLSISRLIVAIISVYLPVNKCLNLIWFGASCLAIAWLIFVWIIGSTSTSLFILGAITGIVFAPMFPLSFGFFNQKLNVIPMLLGLLLAGVALGAMTLNKIAGIVMDRNPNHFPTLLAVCILMAIILYISSHIVYFCHERINLLPAQSSVHEVIVIPPESLNEEEQEMIIHLRNQEDN